MVQPPGMGMPPLMPRAPLQVTIAAATNTAPAAIRSPLLGSFAAVLEFGILAIFTAVVELEIRVEAHRARRPERLSFGGEARGLVDVNFFRLASHRIQDRPQFHDVRTAGARRAVEPVDAHLKGNVSGVEPLAGYRHEDGPRPARF